MENKERFAEFAAKHSGSRIAITTHSKADVDGLACCYALSLALPGSVICIPDRLNAGAELLAGKLGIETKKLDDADRKEYAGLVVVDTSSYTLLAKAREWKILAIIDHHQAEGRDMEAEFMFIDREAPSTAEIIESMLPEINEKTAWALAAAIIADGARFKSARKETFAALARLMDKSDADYKELLEVAEPEPKEEVKVSLLKACQRVQYRYSAGYIIATSEVGSNESDAAALLVEAADVAFVASWKDKEKETRVSARAKSYVKVPLNEVMKEVAESSGGAGGGHRKAAGAYVKAHTAEALEKCMDVFISKAEKP